MLSTLKFKISDFFSKGHERTLRAKKNIAISFITKMGNIVIGLVLLPLTIDYVSPSQYGVWLTVSSMIGWFSFFDIGLGNGLKNKLSFSLALGENEKSKIYVSTTYAVLTIMAGIILVSFSLIFVIVDINWNQVLNITTTESSSISVVVYVGFICFCIQFIVQLLNTVLTAIHQPAKSSVINLVSQALILFVVFILTQQKNHGSLIELVTILAITPVIVLTFASIILYKTQLKFLSPSFKYINFSYTKDLLTVGGVFFFIQIGALILFQTNNIIITRILGPEMVTTFNVSYKLFFVVIMMFSIVMAPYWSAFTDAYAKEDYKWIEQSMSKMRLAWVIFSIITIIILISSPLIYRLWMGETNIVIDFKLSIAMAAYVIAYMWQTLHVYLLNGIGKIKLQLILVTASALINIPLAISLGKLYGLTGIISANTILFVIMGIVFSIQCKKIVNKTATSFWNR